MYIISVFLILFLILYLVYYLCNYVNKYINGGSKFVIGCENSCSKNLSKFLIEKIYPNVNVVYTTNPDDKCNLIVRSTAGCCPGRWNKQKVPHIYHSHERYLSEKSKYATKSLFIGIVADRTKLLTHKNNKNILKPNDTYIYFPDGINYLKEIIDNKTWQKRKKNLTLKEKKYFLGYCFKNPVPQREEFYNKIVEKTKNTDKKCVALCKNHGKYPETMIHSPSQENAGNYGYKVILKTNGADKNKIYSECIFTIAMENTVDVGPSEKIFQCFCANTIPIFWGQHSDIFNKKAYINVLDFKSFDDCIDFILNMKGDEIQSMLNEYPLNKDSDFINYWNIDYDSITADKDNKLRNKHIELVKKLFDN